MTGDQGPAWAYCVGCRWQRLASHWLELLVAGDAHARTHRRRGEWAVVCVGPAELYPGQWIIWFAARGVRQLPEAPRPFWAPAPGQRAAELQWWGAVGRAPALALLVADVLPYA